METIRLEEKDFTGIINVEECVLVNLSNTKGSLVQISNYGARIVSFVVANKKGVFYDTVIGHDSLRNYQNSNERYFNAVIGRYAGRIANGKFKLGGKEIQLSVNNPPNHLHGGFKGLNEQVWKVKNICKNSVELFCFLPSGLDGYCGDLEITCRYTLKEDNSLIFETNACCSYDSIINITNHAFFNLGNHKENILNHSLLIKAAKYLPVDKNLIPTGEMLSVKNTPFDFTSFKKVCSDINANNEQLKICGGYDHSFVCDEYNGRDIFPAAVLINESSGLKLEIFTNQPSLHFYSCNFLNGQDTGKNNITYTKYNALCLETQHFPDSPNHKNFPSVLIEYGKKFSAVSIYKITEI